MPKIKTPPFENFVNNFVGEGQLALLKEALISDLPCIINIYPRNDSEQPLENNKKRPGYDEQARLGGLGKTMAIRESWKYYFDQEPSQIQESLRDIAPVIDLAEQISTKNEILSNIIRILMKYFEKDKCIQKIFSRSDVNGEDFYSLFLEEKSSEKYKNKKLFDPSFVADRLFISATKDNKFRSHFKYKLKPIIFFDGFDAQYLGQENAPLRTWLTKTLFPHLAFEMGIKVFVSGREKIKYDNIPFLSENLYHFILEEFDPKKVYDYLIAYPSRYKQRNIDQKEWNKIITNRSDEDEKTYRRLTELTDGKPIFLDFFADMLYRRIIVTNEVKNIKELLVAIENDKTLPEKESEQKKFKQHLILRLQNHHLKDRSHARNAYDLISKLAIARHGLTAKEFIDLSNKTPDSEPYFKKEIEQTIRFFKEIFNQSQLSYIKDRGDKRLLHDEVAELYNEYSFDLDDKNHAKRNADLAFLLSQYRKKMGSLLGGREHVDYPRLLLEYIDYSFKYVGTEHESKTINRFMYECSHYLDSFSDLNSRLLEKGLKYYYIKIDNFERSPEEDKNKTNTLTVSSDYHLLAKIRFREAEYCLTERMTDWSVRIEEIINEISNYGTNLIGPRKLSLDARIKAVTGEMKIWQGDGPMGRKDISEAKKIFYRLADAHGVLWCDHLLGFEDQRNARFDDAERHHNDAIAGAIQYFPNLQSLANQEIQDGVDFVWAYRLRFLNRILSRANGNLALFLRYKGRIVDAIKILKSNEKLAKSVGVREPIRISSNLLQLFSIINRDEERTEEYTAVKELTHNIKDPLLPKRLALSLLVATIKELGRERDIFRKLPEEYLAGNQMEETDRKKFGEAIGVALNALQTDFSEEQTSKMSTDEKISTLEGLLKKLDTEKLKSNFNDRESADLFYQIGKLLFSSRYDQEKKYAELAFIAFDISRIIANNVRFIYMEMEANEALFRLCLCFKKYHAKLPKFQNNFNEIEDEISKNPAYGIYYDLIAKFKITEGDLRLLQIWNEGSRPPNGLTEPLNKYAEAMLCGHKHNQERYLMILDVFAARVLEILKKANDSGPESLDETIGFLKTEMNKTEIYNLDSHQSDKTLKIFFETYLDAIRINLSNAPPETVKEDLAKIKRSTIALMEKGKFVKAADIDQILIEYYEKNNNEREAFLRRFQLYFCQHGANRSRMVAREIDNIIEKYNLKIDQKGTLKEYDTWKKGIIAVAKGTSIYRLGDFWNIEKLILGELRVHNTKEAIKNIEDAKKVIIAAVKTLVREAKWKDKPTLRIVSEALIRLGELLIFLQATNESEKDTITWLRESFADFFEAKKIKIEFGVPHNQVKLRIDDSPAIFCLNYAYYLAIAVEDTYRQANALQSIAAARYFIGQTLIDKAYENSILQGIHNKIKEIIYDRKNLSDAHDSPLIAANMYLVEGNIYFSKIFEISAGENPQEIKFKLRSEFDSKGAKNQDKALIEQQIKHYLHEMMWAYLSALNELADPAKPYENYHFNNLAYEITRRILLIDDPKYIHVLQENIRPIWSEFKNLSSKYKFRESLENSILIHEISSISNSIFDGIV